MSTPTKVNLKIYQGSTFSETFRWESATKIYRTISGITQAAPAVVSSTAHGIVAGWRAKITNVVGMTQINDSDNYNIVSSVTSNDLTFNDINSVGYSAYVSGGILEYNSPVDLSAYTARMQIRAKVNSTDFIDEFLSSAGDIVLNNTTKTITITIPATITETYTFKSAVYSLEMVNGSIVTPLINGTITLISEITR